ncbi:Isopropylmalate dehydrogenase-like domain-containing protein [Aspergillus undulatus]|uniref:Isopropylmalate dehydrogenase-like domain-containing protein n=1 Tax=Aspergillus undulatus TaxID=1810928 RepID=UPI003CCD8BF0
MASPQDQEATKVFNIALLPGDGIGPQLASYTEKLLSAIESTRTNLSFQILRYPFGGAALAAGYDSAFPQETLDAARNSDAVIVCACNDPAYGLEPEKGLLKLREELGAHANIRPLKFPSSALVERSAYKEEFVRDLDITFVRDLTGGVYSGRRQEGDAQGIAYDTTEYSRQQIERLARLAGQYAMRLQPPKRVHSIDKYNVMATGRLWRDVVSEVFEAEFPSVELEHVLVDTAAGILASDPKRLNGVILAENMFGDILSDQAGGIIRPGNVLASAAVSGLPRMNVKKPNIFEPLDLKKKTEVQNPLAIMQAVALMLELGLGLVAEADALSKAIRQTLDPTELIGSDTLLCIRTLPVTEHSQDASLSVVTRIHARRGAWARSRWASVQPM